MLTKQFINFIQYGNIILTDEFISYVFKENLIDIFIYYCNKYQIKLPIVSKIIHTNYKTLSKQRFLHLIKYLNELEENKISYYIIKGPVTSKFLYEDLFERYYNDIDIVVDTKDYIKLHEILTKNGFNNAYISNPVNDNKESRFAFNIRGEDIIYSKVIDNFEIGFEIRDTLRLINNNQMKIINSHIEKTIYENFILNHLNLEYTIILQIMYAYNAYFTEYGVLNNYKIKYLVELNMLLEKYKNITIDKISNLFKKLELNYMFEKVMEYYYLIFKEYGYEKKENQLNILINLFDDYNNRVKNYYNSLFKNVPKKAINCSFNLQTFNNIGENRSAIIRSFTNKNIQNSLYFTYDILMDEKFVVFFISFPRTLVDITFQIVLINESNFQYDIELTFYKNFINEYRCSIPISYIFNYYDHNRKCLIFKIDKKIFYEYVSAKEFLFKILLRKIWLNKYPIMSFEHTNYTKYIFN